MAEALIKLSRLTVQDFRGLGRVDLDFPERGLVLLTGTNGLGKSTVFDALEWALLGYLDRLDSLHHQEKWNPRRDPYARRHGQGQFATPYRVTLDFHDRASNTGHRIERVGHCAADGTRQSPQGPELAEVIKLLATAGKRAEQLIDASKMSSSAPWKPLLNYLRLTHLFPQSSRLRPTALLPSERYTLLEGPLDAGELAALNFRLTSTKLTNVFKKLLERAEQKARDARARLTEWQDDCRRLLHLQEATAGSDAMTSDKLLGELDRASADPEVASTLAQPSSADAKPRSRLEAFQQALELAIRNRAAEEQQLLDAAQLLRPWSEGQAGLAAAHARVGSEKSKLELLAQAVSQSQSQYEAAAEQARITAGQIAGAQVLRAGVRDQQMRLVELVALEQEKAGLLVTAEQSRAAAAVAGEQERQARRALDDRAIWTAEHRSAQQAVQHWTTVEAAVAAFAFRVAEQISMRDRLVQLEADLLQQRASLASQQVEQERVREQEQELQRRADQLAARATLMANAVAQVAALLDQERRDCPVCGTIHAPGRLKSLAELAATALDPEMAKLQTQLVAIQAVGAGVKQEVGRLRALIATQEQTTQQLTQVLKALDEEQARLATELGASGSLTVLRASSEQHLIAARTKLAQVEQDLTTQPSPAELTAAFDLAVQQGAAARRQVQQCNERLGAMDERFSVLRRCVDEAAEHPVFEPDPKRLAEHLLTLSTDLERLEGAARTQQAQILVTQQELTSAQQALHRAQLQHATLMIEIQELEVAQAARLATWQQLALPDFPNEAGLVEAQARLGARRARLAELQAWRRRLDEGLAALELRRELLELEDKLKKQREARDEAQHVQHLGHLLAEAETEKQQLEETIAERDWFKQKLTEEEKNFNQHVQKPLEEGMKAYWRALSSSDDLELGLDVKTTPTTRQHYSIVHKAGITDPAALIASEGELATLALCMLLAASTRYRWSRWRALLLDDPLGHCDLIRAVSLVDLLRNLVVYEDYQILFATHDDHLGGYIERKMHAAGVECHRYHVNRSGGNSGTIITQHSRDSMSQSGS